MTKNLFNFLVQHIPKFTENADKICMRKRKKIYEKNFSQAPFELAIK